MMHCMCYHESLGIRNEINCIMVVVGVRGGVRGGVSGVSGGVSGVSLWPFKMLSILKNTSQYMM